MPGRVTLRRLWLAGLIAYLGLIALASLLPPPQLPMDPGRYDKLWHGLGYAIAGIGCVPLLWRWRAYALAALMLIAYGALIEVLQGLGGARTADVWDALANGIGAVCGLLLALTPLRGALASRR
jgi:VanZ family protein